MTEASIGPRAGGKHPAATRRGCPAHSVEVSTSDGVKFRHFPCGYGVLESKDAGWTNDLSMFGSDLVHAFEISQDETILADAVSFAEYFVQPWRPGSLGKDGWHCGTWHEKLGS